MRRRKVKVSQFGDLDWVLSSNKCIHAWVGDPVYFWGSMRADWRCLSCGDRKLEPGL